MDFIEQWFQIAPDAGSGVLEAIYLVTAAAVVTVLVLSRRMLSRITRRRADKSASHRP